MKYSDFKKMQKEELDKKIGELKLELMKLSAQVAIGTTPKSTKQIREIKKNLARIETMKSENLKKGIAEMKGSKKKYIHS